MTEFADEEDDFTSSLNGPASSLRLPNPNAEKANLHHGRPLEGLLMSKNRRLQDGMTRLRVAQEELTTSLQNARSELEEITAKYEEQKSLNEKLENDLLRVNGSTPGPAGGSSTTGTGTPRGGTAGLLAPGDASDPLAALNIGRKSMVRVLPIPSGSVAKLYWFRIHRLHHKCNRLQKRQSCPSSQVSEIGSDNATRS